MESQRDTQTNRVAEIAPDGDLILIVGPEQAKLHVHSTFLKAVSKPFSVMLGPDWKEGQDMLARDGTAELPLPEDNAAALMIVCSIIHHKNKKVPRILPAADIFAVAVTADKYDCVHALRFASESWLRLSTSEPGDLMLLTAAAYLFRDAQAFKDITRALIFDYGGPYHALSGEEVEAAMTWKIFCMLEAQRGSARLKVAEILIAGVNDGTGLCVHKCGWTSKYAYAYMKLLEREELWPAQLPKISISKALEVANSMPDPVPEDLFSISCTYEYKHAVPAYRRNRSRDLDAFNKSIGLCLHCVRSDVSKKKSSNEAKKHFTMGYCLQLRFRRVPVASDKKAEPD